MIRMKKTGRLVAAVAAGMLGFSANAAIIDSFGVDMVNVDIESGMNNSTSGALDPGQVIGGFRTVMTTLEVTDPLGTGVSSEINLNNSGLAALSSNFGSIGTWMILWDAAGAGLSADLSLDSFFEVDFTMSELGAAVSITVEDGNSNIVESSAQIVSGPNDVLIFDFADFGGIDFSDVFSIKLTVLGGAGGDYGITQVVTGSDGISVPAPGAFAGGIALMTMMGVTRRRRAA